MAVSPPEILSLKGDASSVKHVVVPALTKSYHFWVASGVGDSDKQDRVLYKEFPSGEEEFLPPLGGILRNLFVTPDKDDATSVVILWDNNEGGVFYAKWNLVSKQFMVLPSILAQGSNPVVSDRSILKILYLRDSIKLKEGLLGSEETLISPTADIVEDLDLSVLPDNEIILIAEYSIDPSLSLPFNVNLLNSVMLAELYTMHLSGFNDATLNGYNITGSNVVYNTNIGAIFKAGGELDHDILFSEDMSFEFWVSFSYESQTALLIDSQIKLRISSSGYLSVNFGVSEFSQVGGKPLSPNKLSHIALTFNSPSLLAPKLYVNGKDVMGIWTLGNSIPLLSFSLESSKIILGKNSIFRGIRISNEVKSPTAMLDYVRGRDK